ncbi:hypothetical protein [Catellatospora paridis]|uniref:hypothetical protein n=1 Tax=Catellatospora paridis TaxID=1617086 RepID=UPI0012D38CB9|nr:hypothetical protein [Catellatospora paridis]
MESANCIARLAQIYDWSYPAWSEAQRAQAIEAFQRAQAFFEVGHHPNIDLPDRASNWVAVIRGAELAMQLAVRGDGGFGLQERRIAGLVDQLRQHLDTAYADTGWDQEGLDYLSYGLTIAVPGIIGSLDAGIGALDASWHRPQFANLLMHSMSAAPGQQRLQWGVGVANGTVAAAPLFFTNTPSAQLPAYLWHYERTVGRLAPVPRVGGSQDLSAILYWPVGVREQDPDLGPAEVTAPLYDDHAGAYQFRSRHSDADDVLVGLQNRNAHHLGWNGTDTFGLGLIGHGTAWARQPAKDYAKLELFSKPLVDGKVEPAVGRGVTLASRCYPGQHGGFLSLDGSGNYQLATARRDVAVDLRPVGGADTVLALHDTFADARSHAYAWQLSPEPGVQISHGATENGAATFLLTKGDAYLKGWVVGGEAITFATVNGALQVRQEGTAADFRIVLAVGAGTPPVATTEGHLLTLGTTRYDLDDLAAFTPAA